MSRVRLVAICMIAAGCGEAVTDDSEAVRNLAADNSCNACTVEQTPARLLGTELVDPPSAPLAGEKLIVYVDDSISGAVLTIEFSAAASDVESIADEVNAVTAGRVTAAPGDGGALMLTTDEAGVDIFLSVYDTPGAEVLGLTGLGLARGTGSR